MFEQLKKDVKDAINIIKTPRGIIGSILIIFIAVSFYFIFDQSLKYDLTRSAYLKITSCHMNNTVGLFSIFVILFLFISSILSIGELIKLFSKDYQKHYKTKKDIIATTLTLSSTFLLVSVLMYLLKISCY